MSPPVTIELLEAPEVVAAGEAARLRFAVTCTPGQPVGVTLPTECLRHASAEVVAEFMTDEVTLGPGDSISLTFDVRLGEPGDADWSAFRVEVKPFAATDSALVQIPERAFRIVPSLDRSLALSLTCVYTYGDAVKVEVTARNSCAADLTDLELEVGPPESVRMGPLKKCVPVLRPGEDVKFDVVVTGPEVAFAVSAMVNGARLEGTRCRAVPSHEARPNAPAAFAFLEPRALTRDDITLVLEKGGPELRSVNGIFPVAGGKSRYRLTIRARDPRATSVRLYKAAGEVEVEERPAEPGRGWQFTITVVENPLFTQLVRLDYDVDLPGETRRGELYLSIRPTEVKWSGLAVTAGLTTTLRGAAGVVPALASLRGEGGFDIAIERIPELFERRWTELLQLASILLIRGVIWVIDLVCRAIKEG